MECEPAVRVWLGQNVSEASVRIRHYLGLRGKLFAPLGFVPANAWGTS